MVGITAAPLLPVGRCCMTAAEIAAALGSARREGRDWRCNCPLHGGRSLTLRNGQGRLLVKCWAGCNSLDVLAELRGRGLIDRRSDGAEQAAPVIDRADVTQRTALARRIWDAARDARGSPVARYLVGRGITIPLLPSLRWAPSLRRPDGTHAPAMIARVDGLDGELIGVHRTWLTRDAAGIWRRRDRATLGPIFGGVVRLAEPLPGKPLVLGEGVESALSQQCSRPTCPPGQQSLQRVWRPCNCRPQCAK
jgi:putative DNA primase/helicase